MKTVLTRILLVTVLFSWAFALSVPAISMNASAASVSGTWVSRISGEGYTQTYIGPYGDLVTDKFDVELELSESGGDVYGTLRAWQIDGVKEYTVAGTLSGSVFYMTAYYGWDGVNYLTPLYTLTVEGDQMYGSGSYLNVGVTITGTFDLEKDSLFGISGLAPVVSGGAIAISIVAIVIAATPPKPTAPKGFQPQIRKVSSPSPRYEPSQQWTTEAPSQPLSGDGTISVGGVGITQGLPARPMTDAEARAAKGIVKPQRANAIGISVVAMVMAVMVNFVEEEIAILMPLFFCFVGLGLAVQARRSSGTVAKFLAEGTVADFRATPVWMKARGWQYGALSIPRGSKLDKMLEDGVPASLAIAPASKHVLSVNGVPLKKAVAFTATPGFREASSSHAFRPAPRHETAATDDDLPPPPDDLDTGACPECGKGVSDSAKFCDRCGHRLTQ